MPEARNSDEAGATLVLKGFSVLRLGRAPAGDFLCQILADAGAKVTAVDDAGTSGTPDIVINDLGRGVAIPAGFGFAEMARTNPDLVYCSLVSFPENGPAGLPELEDAPVLATMGLNRLDGGVPSAEPLRIPSFYGALVAAIYITCGLMPRNRAKGPIFIEVPLFAAAMNILGRKMIRFENSRLQDPQSVNLMLPISKIRKCADGRYLQPQGRYPNLARILFQAAGHPEWADAAADGLEYLADRAEMDMWNRRMDAMFLARPAAEWEQIINDAGGASTLVRSHEEWAAQEQPWRSGILRKRTGGEVEVGPGCLIEEGPMAPPAMVDAPEADPNTLRRPLAGIRVLDFTIIIAGPSMGRILADLGADVIRVDAPDRVVNPVLWMEVNRGKRSLVLDLDAPEARSIARRLAQRSDVILENFRRGKLDPLGLGYQDVIKENPGIVYTSGNLFDQTGPWADRPGWDHNAQAATGMSWSRAGDGVPRCLQLPVNDYGTGLFGALGTLLGLLHRERSGRGSRVAVSLARSASILQQGELAGASPIRPSAIRARTVACRGGWVTAYLRPGQELPASAIKDAGTLDPASLRDRLSGLGFPAAVENTVSELRQSTLLDETGLRHSWNHPDFGRLFGTVPRGDMPGFLLSPRDCAPSPGQDNLDILSEIGLAAELPSYQAAGIVGSFPLFGQRKWATDTDRAEGESAMSEQS